MSTDADRPTITLTADSWPPRFLASGFATSVTYGSPGAAAAGAAGLLATIEGNLTGVWHVEAHDPVGYLAGQLPTHVYHSPGAFILGFSPILADPADETARGLAAEALAGLFTGLATCPEALCLVDWGLAPLRRSLGLEHIYFNSSDPAAFATRADAYAVLRAARRRWLSPWLDGNRRVRNLDAFREIHVDMPDDEAFLAAIVWGQGNVRERQTPTGRQAVAADGLVARGWIERGRSTYGKDIVLSKTRRFAHRFPRVEALVY